MDGKNQEESPRQQLSSTTNRDDSEQVGGRHEEKEQPKEEKPLQKGLTREVLHKESHKTARHNTNKKAKDMDLAPDDKPIKTT